MFTGALMVSTDSVERPCSQVSAHEKAAASVSSESDFHIHHDHQASLNDPSSSYGNGLDEYIDDNVDSFDHHNTRKDKFVSGDYHSGCRSSLNDVSSSLPASTSRLRRLIEIGLRSAAVYYFLLLSNIEPISLN